MIEYQDTQYLEQEKLKRGIKKEDSAQYRWADNKEKQEKVVQEK